MPITVLTLVHWATQSIAVTTGAQDTKVKQKISVESTDSEIEIVAKTKISLFCGASSLTMDAEGNIVITGKTITSIASDDHVVKGAKLHLNPPGAAPPAPSAGPASAPMPSPMAAAGSAGGGGGGGAAGAGPSPTAPKTVSAKASAVKTGLGPDVDKLASQSPSLQKDLQTLKDDGWMVDYGAAGSGSSANRKDKKISLDGNLKGNPSEATQVLAHEVGHATYPYKQDYSSKAAYVNGTLADEGAATLNNIKVQREIIANGGPNIGIAGNSANHANYNKIYDQYLADKNTPAARSAIGSVFGAGETTSTTGQPYADYYGGWYDKNFPPTK